MIKLRHEFICSLVICSVLGLSACQQGRVIAPITDGWSHTKAHDKLYTVQEGDTLYSVAWAFDADYKHLAKVNHLKAPYDLEPGSKISVIKTGVSPAKQAKSTPVKRAPEVMPVKHPAKIPTTLTQRQTYTKPAATTSSFTARKSLPVAAKYIASSPPTWAWPAQGQVVGKFSDSGNAPKGIDIAAKEGSPVFASKNGQVVYSGDGLRGYGKLLIIKHSNDFLSAYAHNQSLLVTEGQTVEQGQQIAAVGKTGAGDVKLHFEIREKGKPVDPLTYLKATG